MITQLATSTIHVVPSPKTVVIANLTDETAIANNTKPETIAIAVTILTANIKLDTITGATAIAIAITTAMICIMARLRHQ